MHGRRGQSRLHAGVKTFCTDEEGAISFYLDGTSVIPEAAILH